MSLSSKRLEPFRACVGLNPSVHSMGTEPLDWDAESQCSDRHLICPWRLSLREAKGAFDS
jgi:hypothetical protein